MSDEIKVQRGTKIEPDEAKTLDRAKMGVGTISAPSAEVEGQVRYWGMMMCPWCGTLNHCYVDTDVFLWFTCGNCGRPFKA